MKKIIYFFGFLFVLIVVTAFKLKSATLAGTNNGGSFSYYIYYSNPIQTQAPEFISSISTAVNDMSPYNNAPSGNTPSFIYGGLNFDFGGNPRQNGKCEIGWGPVAGSPNAGGGTEDYVTAGTYTEFDIIIDNTPAAPWGNGWAGTVDRTTVVRHELGHGVGLDHTSVSSRLMHNSLNAGGGTKNIGSDERNGYRCIYENNCSGQEGGSGNLEFTISKKNNSYSSTTTLKWEIETENTSLIGFNIFEKKSNNYKSLNTELIKAIPNQKEYSYDILNEMNKEYYIEFVGEKLTDKRLIKF